jgi:hypothetical protein
VFVGEVVVRYIERPSGATATANAGAVSTAGWHPAVTDEMQPRRLSVPPGERPNTVIALEKFDGV